MTNRLKLEIIKKYQDVNKVKSMYITDKYHYLRQLTWALENMRKEEQKTMTKQDAVYFKRSRTY